MKRCYLLIFIIYFSLAAFPQKPPLDTTVLGKFPMLTYPLFYISNDARFVSYRISFQPVHSHTLVVQSTEGAWKKEFIGAEGIGFSANSEQFIFMSADTLCFLSLTGKGVEYRTGVTSYKAPKEKNGEWLTYQQKSSNKNLVLRKLTTGVEQRLSSVEDHVFDAMGHVLLLNRHIPTANGTGTCLQWLDLRSGMIDTIWKSPPDKDQRPGNYSFHLNGEQLTFLVREHHPPDRPCNTVWYYKKGMEQAIMKANDKTPGIDSPLFIANALPSFDENGRYIFFKLQEPAETPIPHPDAARLNVWSYKDSVLQSAQVNGLFGPLAKTVPAFAAVIDIRENRALRLEYPDERADIPGKHDVVIVKTKRSIVERWWPSYHQRSTFRVSLKDGSRRQLPDIGFFYSFSPDGRFLVYFDREQQHYFSYDLSTSRVINISEAIPLALGNEYQTRGLPGNPLQPAGIAGWLSDGSGIMVYDHYDIWQLDPSGGKPPVNITNGYGRRHHTSFRLMEAGTLFPGAPVLLSAFNTVNKYNGFYRKRLGKSGDPELLFMGPYTLCHTGLPLPGETVENKGIPPVKARNKDRWIVVRQSASEAPNLFYTKNLKHYKALSHLQPQQGYNWLTTELVSYPLPDGSFSQGILYKPEDFDPQKRYPVIFHYYEQLSHMLFDYLLPDYSSVINIPWFVSNGYLVFTPDIHYKTGQTGQSIYDAVVSAADHLSLLPFVDSKKMGIIGHSFGGYATNYLVTHTDIFAAAVCGAGASDLVSEYNSLAGAPGQEHAGRQSAQFESGQYRIGATLWERPDLYIDQSPIFKADRVTTPLLIMHNKADSRVSWSQGVAFFTGLRRLRKKVWMLEYESGGHGLWGKDVMDYSLRLKQFFDHYLKGAAPPRWMTAGVAAARKGAYSGLELDMPVAVP